MNNRKKGTVLRLITYFKGLELKMAAVITSSILSAALFIASPIFLGKALDQLAEGIKSSLANGTKFQVNWNTMGNIFAILLTLYVLSFITNYLANYMMAAVTETVTLNMRGALMDKLNRLPLRFYDATERGDILSRATNDVEKVADALREGFNRLIGCIISIIGAVIMMLVISPALSVVAFLTIGTATVLTICIASKSRRYFLKYQTSMGELNAAVEETFTGQLVIKAFNQEDASLKKFREINQELYKHSSSSQIAQFIVAPCVRLINNFGYTIVAVLSVIAIIQGRMTIGIVQAFIQYSDKASEPVIELSQIISSMQSAFAASIRYFEIMDELDEVPDHSSTEVLPETKGDVSFEHVRFGYSDDHILMKDINIDVKTGDRIAIVGPTGAGKTTLVNLLMRFYEIQGGAIKIDGVDIKSMSRAELRSKFGMVLQDTWLFGGSIRDNIAYSNFEAPDEAIIGAAKSARADHFIRTLPEGYQTLLTEDGSNVSQGQKQLLTIARAILADPAILILDEATSSVDTRTEAEIQKAMNNLMKGRTSFIIAHKLSTIRDADLILVMDHGTIIEQGTHEELLKKQGFYEKLYNSQFADADSDGQQTA
ncbi:ABC transporter ATP-binding protein [Lacrimispora xylanolytica]|uniref:ABC transporter ATP-binding protein n=1 Tax=Lacrimispora xylanolytica TaxID=29375 RepID=A0ABY7ACL6_9FIRM|nr:ABC transporter ATP-binding protein [Lacrimispora xylanolytica]WAJ24442.1 ABC transporter ATP-binding protein [Lacrimispora xylanolytica]